MMKLKMKSETSQLVLILIKAVVLLLAVQVNPWLVFPCSILLDILSKKTTPTETLDQKMLEPEKSEESPTASSKRRVEGDSRPNSSPSKPRKRRNIRKNGDRNKPMPSPDAPKNKTRRTK